MTEKTLSAREMSKLVVLGMQEKKAQDIAVINLKATGSSIADIFVVCSASSDTQADAISTSVEEVVWKSAGVKPWHREGKTNREWILLDYGDTVVHVFKKDKRAFFALEDLWGDADITYINNPE